MNSATTGVSMQPERSKCPFCEAEKSWAIDYAVDAGLEHEMSVNCSGREYFWRLCGTCGNAYPSYFPDLSILAKFWESNRSLGDISAEQSLAIWERREIISKKGASRSYDAFAHLIPGACGRFLDIACGLGETVKCFSDRGWDAYGIDADPTTKRFHDKIGIRAEIGQIETAKVDGEFDIVHIAHAIYFFTDPLHFLVSLGKRLKPKGVLCIVLANFMAPEDISRPGYPHSFFPTASSMRYLLALAGYKVIACRNKSGSIYIAAVRGKTSLPRVSSTLIHVSYQTKKLRYLLMGRPKLFAHRLAKAALSFVRDR